MSEQITYSQKWKLLFSLFQKQIVFPGLEIVAAEIFGKDLVSELLEPLNSKY